MAPSALRRTWLLAAVLSLQAAQAAHAADRLVLIVSVRSPVSTLNSLEIQKLFLGLTVIVNGESLHPLRNESDDLMRQIFYQNVISMSEPAYERRMLASMLQQGRTAPPVFTNSAALLNAVSADPYAVSFVWAAQVAGDARFKVLRVIWRE